MVFGVRRELSAVRLHYYLTEQFSKFSLKYFIFLLFFSAAVTAFSAFFFLHSAPMLTVNFMVFLFSLAFVFVAQAIVVDEASLFTSIKLNFEYIYRNFDSFLYVAAVGVVLTFSLVLLEYILDYFFMAGWFITVLISLLFLIPFLETLKTQLYMNKFDLIKISEHMLDKHHKLHRHHRL
jgi:hypothetical protein